MIEKKAYELEHRPVQKKYVVETKYEGERAIPGGPTELLGTEAREVCLNFTLAFLRLVSTAHPGSSATG